jgi:hypothetical protein
MPKGGKRAGAGRKPLAIEDDVRAAIKAAIQETPDALNAIWKRVVKEAKAGSDKHTQILFNYYYGKPKDNEGQPTEMIIRVQRRG